MLHKEHLCRVYAFQPDFDLILFDKQYAQGFLFPSGLVIITWPCAANDLRLEYTRTFCWELPMLKSSEREKKHLWTKYNGFIYLKSMSTNTKLIQPKTFLYEKNHQSVINNIINHILVLSIIHSLYLYALFPISFKTK